MGDTGPKARPSALDAHEGGGDIGRRMDKAAAAATPARPLVAVLALALVLPLAACIGGPPTREIRGDATVIIGGSVGIASATTYLFRREQFHTNLLGAHVDPYNSVAQSYIRGLQSTLENRGADASTALRESYGALWGEERNRDPPFLGEDRDYSPRAAGRFA